MTTFADLTKMKLLNMTVDKTNHVFNVGNNVITELNMNASPADKDAVNFAALKNQIDLNLSPINSSISTLNTTVDNANTNITNLQTNVENISAIIDKSKNTTTATSHLNALIPSVKLLTASNNNESDILSCVTTIANNEKTLQDKVGTLRTDVNNITKVLDSTTDTTTLAGKLGEIKTIVETWDTSPGNDLLSYVSSIAKEEVKLSTYSSKSILLNPLSTAINTNGVTLTPVTDPIIPIGGCYYTHGSSKDLCLKFPVQERIFLSNTSYMSCLLYLKNVTNSKQPNFLFKIKTRACDACGNDISPLNEYTYSYNVIPTISSDGVYQFYANINNVASFDASLNILNILTYSKSKLTQSSTRTGTLPQNEYITEICLTIPTNDTIDYVIGNTILQYNNSSFNLSFDTAALITPTDNTGINITLANLLTFLYGQTTGGHTFTVGEVAAGVVLEHP
jgi:hypothetical protein